MAKYTETDKADARAMLWCLIIGVVATAIILFTDLIV